MPIPVPIPGGALAVTSPENVKAELFVGKITQLFQSGTSGVVVSGQPAAGATMIPTSSDPTSLTALTLADAQTQLFYRQLAFAIQHSLIVSGIKVFVIGTTSNPTTSSASFVVMPEMTTTQATSGGSLVIDFSTTVSVIAGNSMDVAIYVDSVVVPGTTRTVSSASSDNGINVSTQALITPAAGSHTIEARWKATTGSASGVGVERSLRVIEMF